jgi:hypothetical protein
MFDAMDVNARRYLDYGEFVQHCETLGLPMVPTFYRGPWDDGFRTLAEGRTNWSPEDADGKQSGSRRLADNIREGFVVKPVRERVDLRLPSSRVIFKLVGEAYLLRKG